MRKKLRKIGNKYYKKDISLFVSTDSIACRMLFGLPSIEIIRDINILKELWHISIECKKENNLLWIIFSNLYLKYCIDTLKQVKNYDAKQFISKGFLFDVCWILKRYNLIKYWDIRQIPQDKEIWDKIIEKSIYESF